MKKYTAQTIAFLFFTLQMPLSRLSAQQPDSVIQIPSKYLHEVSANAIKVTQKLDAKTERTIRMITNWEVKMKRKLERVDSSKAQKIFGNSEQRYKDMEQRLQAEATSKKCLLSFDTLNTSLKFLQQNPQLISGIKNGEEKLGNAVGDVNLVEYKFQAAEEVKKLLKDRKQFLQEQLDKFGFAKQLKKLNKQVYYYSEQLNEYKAMLKDHKKAERKALELLTKTKWFNDFMRKNSMLASLFRLPGDPNDPSGQASLMGLQTRAQVNNLIQQQLAAGGPNAEAQFQQNMQDAQSQMNQLKNRITQYGANSSDDIMPEGFKPNSQKTKSFWKRLQYNVNFQSQKATNLFPVTSDIGLSIDYKLSDKSIVGIGVGYKLGWGRGWNDIRLTNQGVGLRSYVDWKIKGSFWVTGGYEQNYQAAFKDINVLRDNNAWQQSGLLGLSKIVSLKTKFFKNTKVQLLWDFLSYQQFPSSSPIVFRIGYSLK